jgi:hypothetical protein
MSAKLLWIAGLAVLTLTGCDRLGGRVLPGPRQHETQAIELDKAEIVRVEMRMGAGELTVGGGSPRLLDADFDYDNPALKPTVHYESSGGFRGRLLIEQPRMHPGSSGRYEWKLRLNNGVPMELITRLGAGNADMKLGVLNLRGVEVHMGVGNLDMDLRGDPQRDYDVEIHGGVGNATVHVPAGVGIVAHTRGGIGNIEAQGLEKRNDHWVNARREDAKVTIHLDIRGGIGNITLLAE